MAKNPFETLLTPDRLEDLFPADRTDRFFEALFGDANEGAYDIRLEYDGFQENRLRLRFLLAERPGKCLSCSLTHGLPHVFSRHPVIDVPGLVRRIDALLDGTHRCGPWEMGRTVEIARGRHAVPLAIQVTPAS